MTRMCGQPHQKNKKKTKQKGGRGQTERQTDCQRNKVETNLGSRSPIAQVDPAFDDLPPPAKQSKAKQSKKKNPHRLSRQTTREAAKPKAKAQYLRRVEPPGLSRLAWVASDKKRVLFYKLGV